VETRKTTPDSLLQNENKPSGGHLVCFHFQTGQTAEFYRVLAFRIGQNAKMRLVSTFKIDQNAKFQPDDK
jgi:hypothetical protein